MAMESNRSPIYCAFVAKGSKIIAAFPKDDKAPETTSKLMGVQPALHRRYSHTENGHITCYLMEPEGTYCCVMDANVISKKQAFVAMENLRDQFRDLKKLNRDPHFEEAMLVPILKNLLNGKRRSASGTIEIELASGSPSPSSDTDDGVPLIKSRYNRRWSSYNDLSRYVPFSSISRTKSIKHNEAGDVTLNMSDVNYDAEHDGSRSRKPQSVRVWCQGRLKLVIIINFVLCVGLVFLGIYLAVCRGFKC